MTVEYRSSIKIVIVIYKTWIRYGTVIFKLCELENVSHIVYFPFFFFFGSIISCDNAKHIAVYCDKRIMNGIILFYVDQKF